MSFLLDLFVESLQFIFRMLQDPTYSEKAHHFGYWLGIDFLMKLCCLIRSDVLGVGDQQLRTKLRKVSLKLVLVGCFGISRQQSKL